MLLSSGLPGALHAQGVSPQPAAPGVITPKLLRYAERVVRHYDLNQDGRLEPDEWRAMRGKPESADLNRDGRITVEEFAQYAANYGAGRAIRLSTAGGDSLVQSALHDPNAPAGDSVSGEPRSPADAEPTVKGSARDPRRDLKYFASLPAGVPRWFVDRDTDGDGQLTLSEFSPKLLKSEIDDFNRYDLNGDGLLTVPELLRAAKESKSDVPPGATSSEPARATNP
jgi:hypothetical protein